MSKKTVYVVRLWTMAGRQIGRIRNVAGRKLEVTVTSLRAAIALTYGLTCKWEVMQYLAQDYATWSFVGDEGRYNADNGGLDDNAKFWKQWCHNLRAFRQSLRPTFQV